MKPTQYKKKDIGSIVTAVKDGQYWYIIHEDGYETRLSSAKFEKRYEKYQPVKSKES